MRELKFRGWNTETKEMVDLQKITPLALDAGMNSQLAMQNCTGVFIPFFPNIVIMQYTGLHDCKGTPIYEGDILKTPLQPSLIGLKYDPDKDICAEVYWDEVDAMWWWRDTQTNDCYDIFELASGADQCEVIGNIHQHPDLINPPKE